jgi:hypothetical protein
MKYFKPALLARCRSLDDQVADAAAAEWERAIAAYRKHMQAVRPRLPRSARFLLSRVTLHDAEVLSIALGREQPTLTLVLRLEGTSSEPGELLELRYLLVTGPHGGVSVRKHARLSKDAVGRGWILYDEFDLNEQRAFFTHSLLLAGGYEVVIRFHSLGVRRLGEVLVPPLDLPEGERTWPLVGA